MSGLAAVYDPAGTVEPESVHSLLSAIAHRGPCQMTWFGPGVGLGQRLLATTPESLHESLPICRAGGRYQVALDGRLDNREDLLRALALGASDGVFTDPDLIVLSYEKWGASCVQRLVGDFAFVLWDAQERRLLAARDQRGFRPLVYTRLGTRLVFGSEPHQLFALPDVRREVNQLYLACHLTGAALPQGQTPYEGISEVPAGHYLEAQGSRVSLREYWRFSARPELSYRCRQDYVEQFKEVFEQAAKANSRVIRAPGILLSGGLDSSYVAACVVETSPDLKAYSSFVPGSRWDERRFSRAVAEKLGISQREFDVGDCWTLNSRDLCSQDFDQPMVPPQASFMVRSAEVARGEVDVLFVGVGGDEFFTGCDDYIAGLATHGHLLRAFNEARGLARRRRQPLSRVLGRNVVTPAVPTRIRDLLRGRDSAALQVPWIDSPTLIQHGYGAAVNRVENPSAGNRSAHLNATWSFLAREALNLFKWWDRHAFLPRGIEVRAPLWDTRVLDFVLSTPDWVHRRDGRIKALLRDSMRGRVPDEVAERDDKGDMNELFHLGVYEKEAARVNAALLDSPLTGLEYVKRDVLSQEYELYKRNPETHPWYFIYAAVTGGLWLQSELVSRGQRTAAF